jgi:hypothetical protein
VSTSSARTNTDAAVVPEQRVPPDPLVFRIVAGLLVSVASVGLAVVEAFLVPLRIGSVPFPLCVLMAAAGNVLLTRLAGRQTGSILAAALQPVLWLVTVVVLSLPRAEGDVIVAGTLTGLVFLFAGSVAGAYGIAAEITRRTRPEAGVRR